MTNFAEIWFWSVVGISSWFKIYNFDAVIKFDKAHFGS